MIVLDTHVLIYDALQPERLSRKARVAIDQGASTGTLACCDISLWEMAMLIARGRIDPDADAVQFIEDVVQARSLSVLPITPRIAVLAQSELFAHADPADRIIAATAMNIGATLVSADSRLRKLKRVEVVW